MGPIDLDISKLILPLWPIAAKTIPAAALKPHQQKHSPAAIAPRRSGVVRELYDLFEPDFRGCPND